VLQFAPGQRFRKAPSGLLRIAPPPGGLYRLSAHAVRPRRPIAPVPVARSFADRSMWRAPFPSIVDAGFFAGAAPKVRRVRSNYERHAGGSCAFSPAPRLSVQMPDGGPRLAPAFQSRRILPGQAQRLVPPFCEVGRAGTAAFVRSTYILRRRALSTASVTTLTMAGPAFLGGVRRPPGEDRGIQHLLREPQAVRAFRRQCLCAWGCLATVHAAFRLVEREYPTVGRVEILRIGLPNRSRPVHRPAPTFRKTISTAIVLRPADADRVSPVLESLPDGRCHRRSMPM